jgi:hypothetical protein
MRAAAPHTHLWGGGAGESSIGTGAAVNDDVDNSVHGGGITVGFEGVGSPGVFVFLQGLTMSFLSFVSPLSPSTSKMCAPLSTPSLCLPPTAPPFWPLLPALLAPPNAPPPTVSHSKNW